MSNPTPAGEKVSNVIVTDIRVAFAFDGVTLDVEALITLNKAFKNGFAEAYPELYEEVSTEFSKEEFDTFCKGVCTTFDVTREKVSEQYKFFIG